MGGYVYWQFVYGPVWIAQIAITLQRVLARYFSVRVMVTTLFAYWHKDAVEYTGGLSKLFLVIAWNGISRGIGFLVRAAVLLAWLVLSVVIFVLSAAAVVAFVLWPFVAVVSVILGVSMLVGI